MLAQLEEAWGWVVEHFPFNGYIKGDRKAAYIGLARTAWQALGGSGWILDFGAGPCDKTALFTRIGLRVTAYDDLRDPWHLIGDNRQRILAFAASAGIEYFVAPEESAEFAFPQGPYDMVMMHHVLEHLHDSPRGLLNRVLPYLEDDGLLFITVPNAVNLRKRLHVLVGKTNYPAFPGYFWYPGPWRGHVREYVREDLQLLAQLLDLEIVQLTSYNHFWHVVPKLARPVVRALCRAVPSFRDSWLLLARKPTGWAPRPDLSPRELAHTLGRSEYFNYSSVENGALQSALSVARDTADFPPS